MIRIALFGGSGFVGQNLLQLLGDKYKFTIFGRKSDHNLVVGGVTYPYKYTNYMADQLEKNLEEFDVVINLSATKVKKQLTFRDYMENAYIADDIMQACLKASCEKYIHLSSRLVYKENAPTPWNEESPEEPSLYYGISKLVSDKLLLKYNKSSVTDFISLRSVQVYGLINGELDPGQRGSLLFNCVERASAKQPQEIKANSYGARDYLYINDLVNAIDLAIQSTGVSGIYNIGSGKKYTPEEVAKTANAIYKNNTGIQLVDGGIPDMTTVELDIAKAKRDLNYSPMYDLEQGILDMSRKAGENGP